MSMPQRSPTRCAAIVLSVVSAAHFLLLPTSAAAGIVAGGALVANTTWRLVDSPVLVASHVSVPAGLTLTIEPGVVVTFGAGVGLEVGGTLVAKGTKKAPIRFTSTQPTPTPGSWGSVYFDDTSTDAILGGSGQWLGGSILSYVIVEGASGLGFSGAITLWNARPLIDFVTIRKVASHAIFADLTEDEPGSVLTIRNSQLTGDSNFLNNAAGVSAIYRGAIVVQQNVIKGFGHAGVLLQPATHITFPPPPGTLSDALIAKNTLSSNAYGVRSSTGHGVKLRVLDNSIVANDVAVSYYGWGPADVTVTGNVIQGNRRRGIKLDGNSSSPNTFTVTHNIITDNKGDNSGGLWTGDAGALHLINNGPAVVSNNVFAASSDPGFSGAGGVVLDVRGQLTFSGNLVAGNHGLRTGGALFRTSNNAASFVIGDNTFTQNHAWETDSSRITPPGPINFDTFASTPQVEFHGNNVFDNRAGLLPSQYELVFTGFALKTASASGNYWATIDPTAVKNLISKPATLTVDTSVPLPVPNTAAPMSPPSGVTVTRIGDVARITWDPNPETDVAGYRIWYGSTSDFALLGRGAAQGRSPIDVGNVTSFDLTGVPATSRITVTAYDQDRDGTRDMTEGHESWFAPVLSHVAVVAKLTFNYLPPQTPRTAVSLTVKPKLAGQYMYKFWLWDGVSWTALSAWKDWPSFTWFPDVPNPNYRIGASVRRLTDASAPDLGPTVWMDYPIVPPIVVNPITATRASPEPVGQTIVFTASASGGVAPYRYTWWVQDSSGSTRVAGPSTSNTLTWRPTVAYPYYSISVHVESAPGVDPYGSGQGWSSIPYAIVP
jgi:hypothetical protein